MVSAVQRKPPSKVLALLASLVFALAALVACSALTDPEEDAKSPMATYPAPTSGDAGDTGFGAAIEGELVIDAGCLLVLNVEASEQYLPVFPDNASWDAERRTVTTRSGGSYAVGETVLIGGWSSDLSDEVHVPVGCPDVTEVFYVNASDGS